MRQTNLSFEELVHLLQHPEKSEFPQCFITNEIGELAKDGDTRAFQQLINSLKSKDPACRFAACGWLGECDKPDALPEIHELIKTEKNERVLEMAMKAKNQLEIILD